MKGYENIPEHWDLVRLKYVVTIRHEKGTYRDKTDDKYIGLENIKGYSEKLVETDTEYDTSIQSICREGDLLFGKLRPYLAKAVIAPYDAFCTGELLVISDFMGYMRYLRYVMLNPEFISEVASLTYGAKMPRANSTFILNILVPMQPMEEQIQIAKYLDRKISAIDRLITIRQEELTNLEELKKTVISRALTQVDCESVRLKYVVTVRREKGTYRDQTEDRYIGLENIMSYSGKLIETCTEYDTSIQSICREGDLLFGKLRPYLAKVVIAPYDAFCTGELLVIKSFAGDMRYLRYVMLSPEFISEVDGSTYGVKMPRANTAFILNMSIPIPSICKQKEIADYLDKKCAQIDRAIENFTRQIDTLKELKARLISDTVTGKIDVRNIAIPE